MKLLILLLVHLMDKNVLSDSTIDNRQSASIYCTDLNPQNSLDIDQIMGMWYGSEVITHHDNDESEIVYDSCVVIHLADVTDEVPTTEAPHGRRHGDRSSSYGSEYNNNNNRNFQNSQNGQQNQFSTNYNSPKSTRYLRLIWDERGQTLEYTLRFNNTRRGFWMSSGAQHGTMLQLTYHQFTGTVQVLKAVNNQLVLTFCQSLPGSQLFSVVLSRQPMSLTSEDTQSIRNMLKRRGLSTSSVRKVCRNNSSTLSRISALSLVLILILSSFLNCRK